MSWPAKWSVTSTRTQEQSAAHRSRFTSVNDDLPHPQAACRGLYGRHALDERNLFPASLGQGRRTRRFGNSGRSDQSGLGVQDDRRQVGQAHVVRTQPHMLELDALNDLNATGNFARWWSSGEVVSLAIDIWADDLNPANLHHACSVITSAAERFGPELHERFGGGRGDGAVRDAVAPDPTPLVASPGLFSGPPLSPLPTLRAEASPYL